MYDVISEIPPLTEKDSLYIVERSKKEFSYPLHKHEALELNFVENCSGVTRIVGDSIEQVDKYDLVLLGSGLEHTWDQDNAPQKDMREITIQFPADLFPAQLISKTHMNGLPSLFERANMGIAFGISAIMRVYDKLNELTQSPPGFYSVLKFYEVMYDLAQSNDYHVLATSAFAHSAVTTDSRRVQKVKDYIDSNFREEIRLLDLATLANMTPTAFSRFFKTRTGRNISDYIIDVRLGHAARLLASSTMTVVEICYHCGFNNISNFNRIFKKRKGCTPTEFRENYHRVCVIV